MLIDEAARDTSLPLSVTRGKITQSSVQGPVVFIMMVDVFARAYIFFTQIELVKVGTMFYLITHEKGKIIH